MLAGRCCTPGETKRGWPHSEVSNTTLIKSKLLGKLLKLLFHAREILKRQHAIDCTMIEGK